MIDQERAIERLEKERSRKERETYVGMHVNYNPAVKPEDVFNRGQAYRYLSNHDKYVTYKLVMINEDYDKELRDIMDKLYHIQWVPSPAQKNHLERGLIDDILREHRIFASGYYSTTDIMLTAGDVFMHYGEKLAFDMEMSLAKALEMFCENLDLYHYVSNDRAFVDVVQKFLHSDEYPGRVTIFDARYLSDNTYHVDNDLSIPTWQEMYEAYVMILVPTDEAY